MEAEGRVRVEREVLSWLETILAAIALVALVVTFAGRLMMVDGSSMNPTLLDGERLITTPLHGKLKRGDIVVIRRQDGHPIIKRIIGVPGDEVHIDFDRHLVYVNGELLEEPYIKEPTESSFDVEFPVTVPEGCYFVMGDNRNKSDDSRHSTIGMIDRRNIFGKAVLRIWPLDSFGGLDGPSPGGEEEPHGRAGDTD